MNTCVAKYAPKSKHYSKYISLGARVKTEIDNGWYLFSELTYECIGGGDIYLPKVTPT